MSLEPALLAAIAASPDDDLPRLVYADWLDENGRPLRAEFIRLQIEIAKKETLPRAAVNAFSHLWKRQQEILDEHFDDLIDPRLDRAQLLRPEFRRGFLNEVTFDMSQYRECGGVVAGLVPLPERVKVLNAAFDLQWFYLRTWTGLDVITDLSMPDEGGEAPDLTPFLGNFRDCCHWSRLRTLDLESCRVGDSGAEWLFGFGRFSALKDLDLSFNDLTDAGVIALLNTGVPQRLKRLVLGGNPIGDQAAIELADRLGRSKVLENLNLRMTDIGPAGQAALLARLGGRVDLF